MEKANNIVELEKAIYKLKAEPEEWFDVARRLETSALKLQQHHPISKDNNNALDGRATEFMLWGFCLENLFKGLLIKQKLGKILNKKPELIKYKGPKHDLNQLAEKIDFAIDIKEKLALRFFHQAIVYFGRYPIPITSQRLSIYWDDEFDIILKNILDRLKHNAGIAK